MNNRLVLTFISLIIFSVNAQDIEHTDIGYPTVSAALKDLRENQNAEIIEQQGWTTATLKEGTDIISWSFTPATHPAYPAAIKRTTYRTESGAVYLRMAIKCEAIKKECDKLSAEFEELNQQMKKYLENGS